MPVVEIQNTLVADCTMYRMWNTLSSAGSGKEGMTTEQSAAYVNSEAACALIEAMGMAAENQQRQHRGESMAYTQEAFEALLRKHVIGHNAALSTFEGAA